jgi:uncharacterized protein YgfB (UPF0149 family)
MLTCVSAAWAERQVKAWRVNGPVTQLPDFDHTLALSQGNLDAAGLAECHAVACGLLVRQPNARDSAYLDLLAALQVIPGPGPALRDALQDLYTAVAGQLADDDMSFAVWLPDDEQPLGERTAALAQWCNGFLAALGSGLEGRLETLSAEAGEALADLAEIARAQTEGELADETADVEEEELAFAEIVEYIRVVVLMLREDLRGPIDGDSIH